MELCLMIAISLLAPAVVCLLVKVFLMRKSAREIADGLDERLNGETNTLIGISSRDGAMRALAQGLNGQLRRLRAERHRFAQGDRELKEAITAVAHDLRTPLTAIGGYIDLLRREPLTDDARRYLSQIEGRVGALTGLSEELFRYSMVMAARELTLERVDLRAALEEALLAHYAAIAGRGIEPDVHLPESCVPRMLDAEAVSRVFSNILSNAVKYSDGDLTVELDVDGTVRFSNRAKELSAVDIARLFERFYTVQTGRGGAGLGLYIAKQLTEKMGGTITARMDDGKLIVELRFAMEEHASAE